MPTIAILDPGHVLQWIDVHPDYSTRTEPAQVLSALDQLASRPEIRTVDIIAVK
jgi:hypothetical protein